RQEHSKQLIKHISIDYTQDWISTQINQFTESYKKTPFFSDAIYFLKSLERIKIKLISELNRKVIRDISDYLNIKTQFEVSWTYSPQGTKTERIIDIMKKVGATVYLSGPNADCYLDKNLFRENHISLEYKSYAYDPYPQPWGDFIGDVTILDLIANCGPDARRFLKSKEKNLVIIP
ncbi:MAG TPA: WbqC family protein, partial [Methanomicrobiales archaeon]|nr:WbqC family protein [Methanomicrobiales archaeon]